MENKIKSVNYNDFTEIKEKLLEKYFKNMEVSKKSEALYKNGLKSFFAYLYANDIQNPTKEDIIDYKECIMEKRSLNTVRVYLISIKKFFKWLSKENIYKDIAEDVKNVDVGESHKRSHLTKEQLNSVILSAKNNREKMVVILASSLGLRANEIVNIRLSDFKMIDGKICLYILGKARDGKVDYVPINNELYQLIKKYVKEYRIQDYLFTPLNKDDGRKLTTKTIRLMVKNMFKRVGLCDECYTLHSLRHSFATLNIQNGADIREISKALRHKDIHTTEIYLHDIEMKNNKCFDISNDIFLKGVF